MAYGGVVYNSSGNVVFSTDDESFEVVSKGTITCSYLQTSSSSSRHLFDAAYTGSGSNYSHGRKGIKRNGNAVGDFDDGELILLEVNNGEHVFKWQTYNTGSGAKVLEVYKYGSDNTSSATVRYVKVRRASNLTAPTGYGMAFYNSSGDLTWSSQAKILDNVLPLSTTSTTNRWFYFQSEEVTAPKGGGYSNQGPKLYRGIRGNSTSFTKLASRMAFYGIASSSFSDVRLAGSYSRATVGFSANIDWDEI